LEVTCQRCHEMVREADRYCSACGLPQLVYAEDESAAEATAAASNVAATPLGNGGIAWRQALRMAVLVAIPAGVVCSRMSALDWIWIMLAAIWVVRLYARRTAAAGLTTGVGARIGLVTGLLTGWLVMAIDCASFWAQRYLLHQGAQIDSDFDRAMEPGLRFNEQMLQNLGSASGAAAASMQNLKAFIFSPEGRAGMLLSGILISLAIMVFFAVVGGALGARFVPRLRRPEA